jgi:hypothetical protein
VRRVFIPMSENNRHKIETGHKKTTVRSKRAMQQIGLEIGESGLYTTARKGFKVTLLGHFSVEQIGGHNKARELEGLRPGELPMYKQTQLWLNGQGRLYVYTFEEMHPLQACIDE